MSKYRYGDHIEINGSVVDIAKKFYNEGWGFATIRTDSNRIVKITGTLEGYQIGDSLCCAGTWEQTKYGDQLSCTSVVLNVMSARASAVKKWLNGFLGEEEADVVCEKVCGFIPEERRWEVLSSESALLALGVDSAYIPVIVTNAADYIREAAYVMRLKRWGFSDQEVRAIKRLLRTHEVRDADTTYQLVAYGVVQFHRADAVAMRTWEVDHMLESRLIAALVGGLRKAEKEGSTAQPQGSVLWKAADLATVYPEQLSAALERALEAGILTQSHGFLQRTPVAVSEQYCAALVLGVEPPKKLATIIYHEETADE